MNRDYFAKPIQGNGRDSVDYGRTVLRVERERLDWRSIIGWALVLTGPVLCGFWAVWVMLP